MPYLVTCPKCATKLKSGQPVPAGRAVSCPQCKTTFTLTEPAPAIDLPAAGPPARSAPPPPPRARSAPARSSRADEDDDRPRSRRRDEDEEDDRPRSRRRPADEEEEEDRPRGRRKPADDEDEDRPKSRRRRDDDEDEKVPPRSRKRRDEDEDEEDRPTSRKARGTDDLDEDEDRPRSRGKKKRKKGLVLIVGGLAAVFLLCAGGGLAMYFLDPFGMFGGGSSEMLAWAPSDSQALMFIDVEEAEKVSEFKAGLKGDAVDQTKLGLKPEEVSAMLGAGRGPGDPDVTVIKLRAAADRPKLIAACGGKEATASGKKYYKTSAGGGLYFASDKLLVVTKTEAAMTGLLQKENKVTVSDDLRAASKKGDGLMWMAAAGPAAEKGDMIGLMAGFGNLMGAFGMGGPAAPKTAPPKAKTTLMSIKVSGSRGTGRFESTYDSPESAKRIADDRKKAMDQAKTKSSDMQSFDVSTSGATVTLTIVGPVKAGKGGLPGLPFGPGGGLGGP